MNKTQIADLLQAPYARVFQPDPEDGGYTATVLELPGVITEGDTLEEANTMLEEAMALWLEAELEQGHEIPTPLAEREHSGRITVRLGPALHGRAARLSAQEGISLNRWLSAAVAAYAGERTAVEWYADLKPPEWMMIGAEQRIVARDKPLK